MSAHMLVRYRFLSSSHFNHITANVAMSTPDKTLPHQSDNEDAQCADTDPIQDEAAVNIEKQNDDIPMSSNVNNVKQEM